MRIALIVAVADNLAIGKDNKLLWHIPADMKFFRETTTGKPVVMGRKTYQSIGRPLPKRTNIIVSRDSTFSAEGCEVYTSIEEALERAQVINQAEGHEEIIVMGGGEIYSRCLDFACRIYLTEVHQSYDADSFFPAFDRSHWRETSRIDHPGDPEGNIPSYSFVVLDRC